jgi:hypothetical protein
LTDQVQKTEDHYFAYGGAFTMKHTHDTTNYSSSESLLRDLSRGVEGLLHL